MARLYADIQQAPQFRNVVPFEQQLHPSAKTIFRPITTKPITALYTKAGYDALDLSADTNSINQLNLGGAPVCVSSAAMRFRSGPATVSFTPMDHVLRW